MEKQLTGVLLFIANSTTYSQLVVLFETALEEYKKDLLLHKSEKEAIMNFIMPSMILNAKLMMEGKTLMEVMKDTDKAFDVLKMIKSDDLLKKQ